VSDGQSDVRFETITDITDYDVLWNFGDGVWSTFRSVEHHYSVSEGDSLFHVVFNIADRNGCVDTIRETIYVDLYAPTLFFPGLGQKFMDNCESCKRIEIYDRLGVKLYEGPSGWDGMYKGRYVDPDTYFYVITLKFKIFGSTVRKGYITVGRDRRN
jgi:gliding motility-associated-like protein